LKRARITRRAAAATGAALAVCLCVFAGTASAGNGHGSGNGGSAGSGNYTIPNDTPGFIKHAQDTGSADQSQTIDVTVWLSLHNESQLDSLVQQQRTKGSPNYHKWIDASTFASTYSPTSQEVSSVTNFLTAHGLTVNDTAENNLYVNVSGTVAAIEKAFHVQIDSYTLDGQTYYSNTSDPSVNDPSGAHVAAITGLDDYGYQPNISGQAESSFQPFTTPAGVFFSGDCFGGVVTDNFKSKKVSATYSGLLYGTGNATAAGGTALPCGYSPSEIQTAYGLNDLYKEGLDGSGQTIVITDAFGSPTIQQDLDTFDAVYGLPKTTVNVFRAPGAAHNGNGAFNVSGWAGETTLDVEWAHALAPGATIDLVVGPTPEASLDEAINYAVVHHLGNVISNSWSAPEAFGNPARFNRDNRLLEEAAAEGVDVNFATGDYGDETDALGLKQVDFPASSPYATGIGGTSLALNADSSRKWETGWGTNLDRLVVGSTGAIADPPQVPAGVTFGDGFYAGAGGGVSQVFSKPDWQTEDTSGSMRGVPDISMDGDPYTGVEIIQTVDGGPSVGAIGGTSLATPLFSAVMAIASQAAGHGLGQAAPLLYPLQGTSAINDVLPAGPSPVAGQMSSTTDVTGSITDRNGTTTYSAAQLALPSPEVAAAGFGSALYTSPSSKSVYTIGFGTDSSLATTPGWDEVTGVGTPNGADFVHALAGN